MIPTYKCNAIKQIYENIINSIDVKLKTFDYSDYFKVDKTNTMITLPSDENFVNDDDNTTALLLNRCTVVASNYACKDKDISLFLGSPSELKLKPLLAFTNGPQILTAALVKNVDANAADKSGEKNILSYEFRLYFYKMEIRKCGKTAAIIRDNTYHPDLFSFSSNDFTYTEEQYKERGVDEITSIFNKYIDKHLTIFDKLKTMFDDLQVEHDEMERIINAQNEKIETMAERLINKSNIVLEELAVGFDEGIEFNDGSRNNGKIII